jgi:hypothetical protein
VDEVKQKENSGDNEQSIVCPELVGFFDLLLRFDFDDKARESKKSNDNQRNSDNASQAT